MKKLVYLFAILSFLNNLNGILKKRSLEDISHRRKQQYAKRYAFHESQPDASPIFQILLASGKKSLELSPDHVPSKVLELFSRKFDMATFIAPYFPPLIFNTNAENASFSRKKITVKHELMHVQQYYHSKNFDFDKKLHPASGKYYNVETEADMEAAKHTSCWKCVDEYAYVKPLKDTGRGPIGKLLSWFGFKQAQHLIAQGYADFDSIKKIAQEKEKEGHICPSHQELDHNIVYNAANIISPLIALGCYALVQRQDEPLNNKKVCGIMASALLGLGIESIIKKHIERQVENRVASGELEAE